MKRVNCLYRVSTKKQVSDKDDIPMQQTACLDFVSQHEGWVITREFFEKGVSGYKVASDDRDALQELKRAAANGEFDILLVFMFDRLGRREDETPFVVEWFDKQGIEIWSVKEGQQCFTNHTDKLLNYIRFWQANGESAKTSERVKTRLAQLTAEGRFTGGAVPFGYKLIPTGEVNKKGRAVRELVIDEDKADIVRQIFDKTVHEGRGSHQISAWLNEQGYRTPKGAEFQCNYINRMLKNKLYCGYFVSKETVSPKQEHLAIVDEGIFAMAQDILSQRNLKNAAKSHIAMTTRSDSLLSGNIFCGCCGMKLASTKGNYRTIHHTDGTVENKCRRLYVCYHKSRRLNDCFGQSVYQAEAVEEVVLNKVRSIFGKVLSKPREQALAEKYKEHIKCIRTNIRQLKAENEKLEQQLTALSAELGKSLIGESAFTADMINMSVGTVNEKLNNNRLKLREYNKELDDKQEIMSKLDFYYDELTSWAKSFETAEIERKKMILCQLFSSITISSGYEIDIVVNPMYEQFLF